jgi:hypothetical protein
LAVGLRFYTKVSSIRSPFANEGNALHAGEKPGFIPLSSHLSLGSLPERTDTGFSKHLPFLIVGTME